MPDEPHYTLQDLADLAEVTPRTIRYYVAQGLLPSPDRAGPGALYGPGHLARLRLIRSLQREHLPLAEIRAQLAGLDDASVIELIEAGPREVHRGTAAEYIRSVLAPPIGKVRELAAPAMFRTPAAPDALAVPPPAAQRATTTASMPETPPADRSQWDRIVLIPDVELHVRRPLTRHLNKQVERLIAIARQLLEEDLS